MLEKSRVISMVFALTIVLFIAVSARNAAPTVVGGLHDFSATGGSPTYGGHVTGQVCVFCHTPHGANTNQWYTMNPDVGVNKATGDATNPNGRFLWNRRLPARTFQMYASPTLNASASRQPGIFSLMCLSCHDGVGGINVLLNYAADDPLDPYGHAHDGAVPAGALANQLGEAGFANFMNIGGADNCGSASEFNACTTGGVNLQDDHPIGFSYDAVQAVDSGLKPFADVATGIKQRLNLTGASHDVECSTCHDPHRTNYHNSTGCSPDVPAQVDCENKFLVIGEATWGNSPETTKNEGSVLCLSCHNK